MITLYDCSTAPSPRRARILLAEKGLAHKTVQIDLRRGEQLGEAYRAINPSCTVPALRLEDGTVLGDNAAIIAWADAVQPEPALLGRGAVARAEVASWHWRSEFEGLLAVAEVLRNRSPAMAGRALPGPVDYEQIPALAERGQARLRHFFDTLDRRLQDRETLAGGAFSVADITAVVAVDFARAAQVSAGPAWPHLWRWRLAMGQRASIGPPAAPRPAGG